MSTLGLVQKRKHKGHKSSSSSFKKIFKKRSSKINDDEALEASLMRNEKNESGKMQYDQAQTEMIDKISTYHRVDLNHLRQKYKKNHQFSGFIRKNQLLIDDARTANIAILGTSGSGKTKCWWNFLNYYDKPYNDPNSWSLSPKDFYNIITEKIMNISVDILIEYNYMQLQNKEKTSPPSTCLSMNDLIKPKKYKLELDTDDHVKEGYDFFQDLIGKLEKIEVAINANVQIEEVKKMQGQKPNWDKIQELRNIEKEIKEFTPSAAPKVAKLWKSKQLRDMYLYQYGLHNARNLFYFIDHIKKFVQQKQQTQSKHLSVGTAKDDWNDYDDDDEKVMSMKKLPLLTSKSNQSTFPKNKKFAKFKPKKWEWNEWGFEEILRCQVRTTGVIEQDIELECNQNDKNNEFAKFFNPKIRVYDLGGAQNERKKWRHVLNTNDNCPDMDCVLFVVNLMSYYKKSWESKTNGLLQSLQLFSCLLSHGASEHDDNFHVLKDYDDEKQQIPNLLNANSIAMARSLSDEQYNVCIDAQVKRAMNDISLFYVIFTDTEGMKEMLQNGISFKTCFPNYDGDNSIVDVQTFIENQFQKVIDDSNLRIMNKNDQLFRQSSAEINIAKMPIHKRRESLNGSFQKLPSMQRAKTTPTSPSIDEEFDDDDFKMPQQDAMSKVAGQKQLKCRFVSVIDHDEMKSVMNEIVESSLLNKNALNTVVHSLTLE